MAKRVIMIGFALLNAFVAQGSHLWEEDEGRFVNYGPRLYGSQGEPIVACLKPWATSSREEVDTAMRPFFAGINDTKDDGCQYEGQTPKKVCLPAGWAKHIKQANEESKKRWQECWEKHKERYKAHPPPAFQPPFTNHCSCKCQDRKAIVCWGAVRRGMKGPEAGIHSIEFKEGF